MLLNLGWDFLKKMRFVIPVVLLVGSGVVIYNSQAISTALSLLTNGQKTDIGQVIQAILPGNNQPTPLPTPTPWPSSVKVSIKTANTTAIFTTEVADSAEERQTGYMYRPEIPEYNAMLFIFEEESQNPFHMKNVEFPLDMIFIDKDYKIVDIVRNAQPCKLLNTQTSSCPLYTPKKSYIRVLEIKGGMSNKLQITEESEVRIVQ